MTEKTSGKSIYINEGYQPSKSVEKGYQPSGLVNNGYTPSTSGEVGAAPCNPPSKGSGEVKGDK